MLVNVDVKGLEVVVVAQLSGDEVLRKEIIDKVDIHDSNRVRFGLGEGKPGRLVAKIFKFRLIYGGSAYSYANDPDFTGVSTSQKFWQRVIDEYYAKYRGIARWHGQIVETVKKQGYLEIPSGRFYTFEPTLKRGEMRWPITQIKNYPVQGFGADLVMLARIEARRLIKESGLEAIFIQTIHDSLVLDTPEENVYNVSKLLKQAVESVPRLVQEHFNYNFDLPLTCEIQVGPNKLNMKEIAIGS